MGAVIALPFRLPSIVTYCSGYRTQLFSRPYTFSCQQPCFLLHRFFLQLTEFMAESPHTILHSVHSEAILDLWPLATPDEL